MSTSADNIRLSSLRGRNAIAIATTANERDGQEEPAFVSAVHWLS